MRVTLCQVDNHQKNVDITLHGDLVRVVSVTKTAYEKAFKLVLRCGDDTVETFVPYGEKVDAVAAFFEDHRRLKLPFGAIMKIRGHDICLEVRDVNRRSGIEI